MLNVPEDFSVFENRTIGVTLPQAIDEEPETFALQNQIPVGDVSEVSGAANMRSLKSKSIASLNEVFNSEDPDVHAGRAFDATLPQATEEEPEMIIAQQSQLLSGVYALSGAIRPSTRRLRSKSDESLYEMVAFKDVVSLESTAAVGTLPLAIEDDPKMTTPKQMLMGSCELNRAVSSGIGGLVLKADGCLIQTVFRDLDLHENTAASASLHVMEEGQEITALQSPVMSGVCELSTETTRSMRNLNSQTGKSQRETLTPSGSQSHLSVGLKGGRPGAAGLSASGFN